MGGMGNPWVVEGEEGRGGEGRGGAEGMGERRGREVKPECGEGEADSWGMLCFVLSPGEAQGMPSMSPGEAQGAQI